MTPPESDEGAVLVRTIYICHLVGDFRGVILDERVRATTVQNEWPPSPPPLTIYKLLKLRS